MERYIVREDDLSELIEEIRALRQEVRAGYLKLVIAFSIGFLSLLVTLIGVTLG